MHDRRQSQLLLTATFVVALFLAANCARAGEPGFALGPNLIPQGGFESWRDGQPDGWTVNTQKGECAADETVLATGQRSLRLRIPAGGGSVRVVSPSIPAAPGIYLARFMMRVVGLSQSRAYEGGQAGMFIEWLDERQAVFRLEYVAYSYFPMELSYRDQLLQTPPGTSAFRVTLELYGNAQVSVPSTAWFDDVAVCRYTPPVGVGAKVVREWSVTAGREVLKCPDAPAWFYLAGVDGEESVQGQRVRDERALLGAALHARPGVPAGMVYHSAYTVEQPPGLYRVYLRVRAPATPPAQPAAPLLEVDVISSSMGLRGRRVIKAADFHTPGEYEDFWFDIVKPSTGWLAYRIMTPGKDAEFWLDHIRVVELVRFRDPDLLRWYPGLAGSLGRAATLEQHAARRVLLVEGLLGDLYRSRAAVRRQSGWELTVLRTEQGMAGPSISGYPAYWNELRAFNVVVLANASLEGLGPEQRYQLRKFVELGGGLLVFGGKSAYGNGGIRGSFLEEVLPVVPADSRFDIVRTAKRLALDEAGRDLNLELPAGIISPFLHRVTLRPGATVLARAGQEPFLVAGTFGKGRVVCLLGTPCGRAPAGATLLTDWPGLPELVGRILKYLTSANGG